MNKFLCAFVFLFSFSAIPAFAQDNSVDREVEEVVVTALRKETSLQDTAITITAITGSDLAVKQIENFEDLQFAVPTLGFAKGAFNGSGITLRGIGNFAVGNSTSAAIGYFWNGQSASASGLYEAELYDVERVEVLRGPQGSLFGAGTTGGVIQMITKRPDGEVGGNIKVDLADYDSSRISGAINLPFSDTLRSRFAFASLKRGGMVTNNYNGAKLDDRNTMSGRMSLEWDYSDDTTISLIYENTQADDNRLRAARQYCKQDKFYGCSPFENGMEAVWSPGSYGHWVPYLQFQNASLDYTIYRNNPSTDIRSVDLDSTPTHETVLQNSVFEIDSALSDTMNMVFTYSYHTRQYEDYADYDHAVSVVPFQLGPVKANLFYDPSIGNMGRGEKTFSSDRAVDRATTDGEWAQTELRFSSDYDGAFNFTLGFFNLDTQSATTYGIATPYMEYWGNVSSGPNVIFSPASAGYGGAPYWVNYFGALPVVSAQVTAGVMAGLIPPAAAQGAVLAGAANAAAATAAAKVTLPPWQKHFHADSNLNRNSKAVYGEMYFALSDVTNLTLGGRYTEFEINDFAFNSLLDLQNLGAGYYGQVKPSPVPRSYASDESTYKLGIDHALNDNQMIYATYSTGFKPGGFNTTDIVGLTTFEPEIANTLEIGMKNTLMDGALLLNVSAYANDYEGLQLSKIVNRASLNSNADATIEGVEAEFTFFLSSTIMIDGFVSKTSATVDDFQAIDPLNPNAATKTLSNDLLFAPIGGTATGFLKDWLQYTDLCVAGIVTGGPCQLAGAAGASALLANLVLYQNTDAGIIYKSFGPLCTVPFFGLNATTLPCPASDGVAQDLSGNSLPGNAELNWRLGITKFIDTKKGTWTFRADHSYRDDYYSTVYNRAREYVEDVSLTDLSIKYTPASEEWYVGAYVRNLGDVDHTYNYYSTDVTVGGFQNGVAIDPKIWGINFGRNF
ncbi:TonB-dependent receptor [Gammaproteobacteria bacterium]|jgi:outer membrane receptor protein involved in Fe transport|nr:TonB-dependent receptor [Gammaproteobacteria bacterium]